MAFRATGGDYNSRRGGRDNYDGLVAVKEAVLSKRSALEINTSAAIDGGCHHNAPQKFATLIREQET